MTRIGGIFHVSDSIGKVCVSQIRNFDQLHQLRSNQIYHLRYRRKYLKGVVFYRGTID